VLARIQSILLSSWFIALIISVVIIIFLPPIFDHYKIEILESGSFSASSSTIFFSDLNNDHFAERIMTYKDPSGISAIQVFDPDGGIYDQWNLPGSFPNDINERLYFGDYNDDLNKEIYVFSQVGDSIFLSCFDKLDGSFRLFKMITVPGWWCSTTGLIFFLSPLHSPASGQR